MELMTNFKEKDFMTEAVNGIIKWAANEPNVKSIIASTEKSNIASFTVLEKNKFAKTGETETMFHWWLAIK